MIVTVHFCKSEGLGARLLNGLKKGLLQPLSCSSAALGLGFLFKCRVTWFEISGHSTERRRAKYQTMWRETSNHVALYRNLQ